MLITRNTSVSYGRSKVLKNLSISVGGATILGVVAPNGAGKTTMLRVLAGLVPQPKGTVEADGIPPHKRVAYRRKVFFIEDAGILNPALSAMDYLRFVRRQWRSSVNVDETVRAFGIEEFKNKAIERLSLGMRQLLIIAMCLVSDAQYLLLDEPMNGLDPTNTHIVSEHFKKIRKKGKSIVMSSHLLNNIDALADQVCYLKDGRIVYTALAAEQVLASQVYRELYLSAEEASPC